jgi:hypothetical protein
LGAHRGDIGDQGGVGQFEFGDRLQRRGTRVRPQIADVVRAKPDCRLLLTPCASRIVAGLKRSPTLRRV